MVSPPPLMIVKTQKKRQRLQLITHNITFDYPHSVLSLGRAATVCGGSSPRKASKPWVVADKPFGSRPSANGSEGNKEKSRNQGHSAYVVRQENLEEQDWYVDSGATHHVTNNESALDQGNYGSEGTAATKELNEALLDTERGTEEDIRDNEGANGAGIIKATHPMVTRSKSGVLKPKPVFAGLVKVVVCANPVDAAVAYREPHWRKEMEEEYEALMRNKTWRLVPYAEQRLV